jgi:hypothetical protein
VRRYVDIEMPDEFVLEVTDDNGEWIDWGLYLARDFERKPDGAYLCAGHGGSPLWLRCLTQRDDSIDVVDGGGREVHLPPRAVSWRRVRAHRVICGYVSEATEGTSEALDWHWAGPRRGNQSEGRTAAGTVVAGWSLRDSTCSGEVDGLGLGIAEAPELTGSTTW